MITDITASLKTHFGFTSFRPGQAESIQSLLNGEHTLAVMPTGSGKSLIYQLAALHLPGITLVISPLVALMKDQVDSLRRRGIQATFINSSLLGGEQKRRLGGLAAGAYRIIYIAPERLRSAQFLKTLQNQTISLLAVDEAHCISEWGHDFRPDYLNIAQFRIALGNPLTAALTATATPLVQDDIARLLGLSPVHRVITGFNRPNLFLEVGYITDSANRIKALQGLLAQPVNGATIIYTGTRRDAEEVAEFVSVVLKIKAQHYHAGLSADERTRIQDEFMTNNLSIIAATNAFGMGIDRPDVRQVIHYSMPSSLEAYYQEAGRAGRDELPARVVLLYSPQDRALQEWFIENSCLSVDDLRRIFEALRPASEKKEPIAIEDISFLTSLPEIKVRVGISELERASMLERFGNEGIYLRIRLQEWKVREIQTVLQRHLQHQAYRRTQLKRMVDYAESNACRRRIILNHFGDAGRTEAELCCDNCKVRHGVGRVEKTLGVPTHAGRIGTNSKGDLSQTGQAEGTIPDALIQSGRTALIILNAVQRLHRSVGGEKLAQILKGSKAKDILQFGYDKNVYYGQLAVFSISELKGMINQLLEMRYLKSIGGDYPVLRLTPQGEKAITNQIAISLELPRKYSFQVVQRKKAERQAGGTLEFTARFFSDGMNVEQIATMRALSTSTIYGHAAKLIATGRVKLGTVVSLEVQERVEAAICQVGSVDILFPIKLLLPDEIDYNMIRCVVENWKRFQSTGSGKAGWRDMKNESLSSADLTEEDAIADFLSRPHPRKLPGPWIAGWALGFHSRFSGADWQRSEAGELAYRLKYQDDLSVLPRLVEQAASLVVEHPELAQVDEVVPVPPTTQRLYDPVSSFAKALAEKLGLGYSPVLIKSRQTTAQKVLHTLAQKRKNVAGAFDLKSPVKGKRLLVVDDLFDSGATLEEICCLLRLAGASEVSVLTMTRTIHSDA